MAKEKPSKEEEELRQEVEELVTSDNDIDYEED